MRKIAEKSKGDIKASVWSHGGETQCVIVGTGEDLAIVLSPSEIPDLIQISEWADKILEMAD